MLSDYKYKIELHNHTYPATDTASVSPEWAVRRYKDMEYDAVVFTNKIDYGNVMRYGAEKTFAMYMQDYETGKIIGEKLGIKVLQAMEVTVYGSGRDYLVYGVDENTVKKAIEHIGDEISTFYKSMSNVDTVILQAHPFRPNETRASLEWLDGIEILNMNPSQNSCNGLALKHAYNNRACIVTGGSDTHAEGDECCISMLSRVLPEDSFELARILRSGDYLFDIGGNIVIPYTFTGKL